MKYALLVTILFLASLIGEVGIAVQTMPLTVAGQGMSALDAELYAAHMQYARRADEIITRRQTSTEQRERELRGLLKERNETLAEIRARHGK